MIQTLLRIVTRLDRYAVKTEQHLHDAKEALNWTAEAKKRLKLIKNGYNGGNSEYKKIILPYWKKYGLKPPKLWFDLYCAGKTAYNPRFIPDSVWFVHIIPYFNCTRVKTAYNDKSMFNRFMLGVKKPETVVKKIGGHYYNGDGGQIISRKEAEKLCCNEEHLIVKPAVGMKGQGIAFYGIGKEETKDISAVFDKFPKGFVAQKILQQHPMLARLNPSSVNTVRVISFHFKDEIHILSAQLRIGRSGARVDNVSAGGCACPIKPDGWLQEKSVNRQSEWTDSTPGGIKYKDIQIPNYSGILDSVRLLHKQLPYFNIVGWDFSVDEHNNPVLIEYNTKPGQNQIGCGQPTFGDMTDEVLEDVFIKKALKNAFVR